VTGKSGASPARSRHRELDFGFWILDFGLKPGVERFFNPKSKIQNPKLKSREPPLEAFCPDDVSRKNIRGYMVFTPCFLRKQGVSILDFRFWILD
jgi:hypothetical protein